MVLIRGSCWALLGSQDAVVTLGKDIEATTRKAREAAEAQASAVESMASELTEIKAKGALASSHRGVRG